MVIGVDGPVPHVCNFHEWHGVVLGRQQLRPVRGRDTTFSSNTNIGLRRITFQIRQYECKPHVRHLRVRRRLLLGNQRRFATGRWDGDSENATYRRDVAYWCFIRLGIHQRSVHLRIDQFRFNGKTDGSEQGVFGLLKGGFRAITGLIGRVNKEIVNILKQ